MKQSIFKKTITVTGSKRTVNAEIITTMNYSSKTVTGTHSATHDDYSKNTPVHKVEVFINGGIWKEQTDLSSEQTVYDVSKSLINLAKEHCEKLSNEEPVQSFGEKMMELFSDK